MKTVCETILSAPESEVPQGAFDFMAWMSGHLSVVPDDCRASARIRLMPVGRDSAWNKVRSTTSSYSHLTSMYPPVRSDASRPTGEL